MAAGWTGDDRGGGGSAAASTASLRRWKPSRCPQEGGGERPATLCRALLSVAVQAPQQQRDAIVGGAVKGQQQFLLQPPPPGRGISAGPF